MAARPDDRLKLEVLFEPARYYHDEILEDMSLAAAGAYSRLFAAGFSLPEPGVFRDNDRSFAATARCDLREWLAVREEVARAFDTTSRPGWWIQKGTVETMHKKAKWIEAQRVRGQQGAEVRWRAHGGPMAGLMRSDGDPIANGVGMEGLGSAENQSTPPARSASRTSPTVTVLLTKDPEKPYAVTVEHLAKLVADFPEQDVTRELSSMRSWCEANPGKRKTYGGMPKFITGWLIRQRGRGTPANGATPDSDSVGVRDSPEQEADFERWREKPRKADT